jgi:hypothetical protein
VKNDSKKYDRNSEKMLMGTYDLQTLASLIKTRTIIKNAYGMKPSYNRKLNSVKNSEAKETIWQTIKHDYENNK